MENYNAQTVEALKSGRREYAEYKCAYWGTTFFPAQAPGGLADVVLVQGPPIRDKIEAINVCRVA